MRVTRRHKLLYDVHCAALCHGIPSVRPFKSGDYISLDVTVFIDGVHGDNCMTVQVGDVHGGHPASSI